MNFSLKGLDVKLASLNFSHASLREKKTESRMSPKNKGRVEGWEGGGQEEERAGEMKIDCRFCHFCFDL